MKSSGTNDVVKNERDSSDRGDTDLFSYDAECSFRVQNVIALCVKLQSM